MARTRQPGGGPTHTEHIFQEHHAQKKYAGTRHAAPSQGHHHGGGYTPGASAGNLVTKGNLNIPSGMYKAYNVKPYVGKTHPYGPVPIALGIHARGHGPAAPPATSYSTKKQAPQGGLTDVQKRVLNLHNQSVAQGRKNALILISSITGTAIIIYRAAVAILRNTFAKVPSPTGEDIPGQGPGYKGSSWEPSSYYGVQPGESPWWEVPPGPFEFP